MAKSDHQSPDYTSKRPYQDQTALVAAIKELAAAMARRSGSEPSDEARAAGIQYRAIKGALSRYFEVNASTAGTGSSGTGKNE